MQSIAFVIVTFVAFVGLLYLSRVKAELKEARSDVDYLTKLRDHYREMWRLSESHASTWRQAAVNFEQAYNKLLYEREYAAASALPPRPISRADQDIYQELIEAGRRALAKKYHPDLGGSEEMMKAVNAVADRAVRGGSERSRT